MEFEPTNLRDLVGCSNYRDTRDSMVSKDQFLCLRASLDHGGQWIQKLQGIYLALSTDREGIVILVIKKVIS